MTRSPSDKGHNTHGALWEPDAPQGGQTLRITEEKSAGQTPEASTLPSRPFPRPRDGQEGQW